MPIFTTVARDVATRCYEYSTSARAMLTFVNYGYVMS